MPRVGETSSRYRLWTGDNLAVLRSLPANSIDAIVTDPPYGLGKEPEALEMLRDWLTTGHHDVKSKGGFMGKTWDNFVPQPAQWKECLRVLKPGGHLLTFAGTRTQDLVTLGLRIAGFEIRDTIAWVYGSGFPKSLDVSKAIDKAAGAEREVVGKDKGRTGKSSQPNGGSTFSDDSYQWPGEFDITAPASDAAKQWAGWGTALKPAFEPITVARKPLIGTVAENVQRYGTGAINVDGCRVEGTVPKTIQGKSDSKYGGGKGFAPNGYKESNPSSLGRFPANLIHSGEYEVVNLFPGEGDKSAARFFYAAKASKRDRDEGLEAFAEVETAAMQGNLVSGQPLAGNGTPITTPVRSNVHPTVKPTELMRYLCRLVTPPNGLILDPFMGSGSTGKAAMLEGFRFYGIDLSPEYVKIAEARIKHALTQKE